jgi:hypothetical protein
MSSKRKMPAKSPHTWNRRGFNIAPNGYFTVLKPSGWFAASRLPGGFRYLGGQSKGPAFAQTLENGVGNPAAALPLGSTSVQKQMTPGPGDTTIRLQTIEMSEQDHRLVRPTLVVLAATAIMSILLWWIAFRIPH